MAKQLHVEICGVGLLHAGLPGLQYPATRPVFMSFAERELESLIRSANSPFECFVARRTFSFQFMHRHRFYVVPITSGGATNRRRVSFLGEALLDGLGHGGRALGE